MKGAGVSARFCEDVPLEPMSAKRVYSLISNYRNNHYNSFIASGNAASVGGAPMDGRSVWFSLNKMKKFINQIEKLTQNHLDTTQRKCVDKLCDLNLGIRIYFGEYGGESSVVGLDKFHTLVMVPTYEDKSVPPGPNTNVDFDPMNMSVCTPRSIPLDTTLMNMILALTPDVGSMNYGGVIPPPDPQGPLCTGARLMHLADVKDSYRALIPLCY